MANDDNDDSKFEDTLDALDILSLKHLMFAVMFVLAIIIIFVVGVFSLATAFKSTEELLAIKPENRAEIVKAKIETTRDKVSVQYAEHLAKMDNKDIYTVNQKFQKLYQLSLESEKDYADLVSGYQKAVYQLASKVRGSGEWYFYYDKKLNRLVQSANKRLTSMNRYFER